MRKIAGKIGAVTLLLLFGLSLVGVAQQKVVTIKAWTVGPDDPSITRKLNLEAAGERLNKILEAVGADVRVKVEAEFNTVSWDSFKKRNLLALQTRDPKQIADIIVTGHEDIALYAVADYIIPLDEYIAKYPEVYEDFIPTLWDCVEFQGKIWGIPQDTEARVFWYRKDLLRELGWSEEEIATLPQRVIRGEFTLDDLAALGKELQDKGIVEKGKGIWHRPSPGTDWFQFIFAYGGEIYDPATGKLVVDRSATLKTLQYLKKLVDSGVTPSGMTRIEWRTIHSQFTGGKVGIFLTGGIWHWAEWQRSPYSLSEEYEFENIGWAPIPSGFKGGKPISVSHPLVHLITKTSPHPELAFLLVTLASEVDLNTKHAVQSGHLAVRNSQLSYQPYAEALFLKKAAEILQFSRFSPNHPKAPFYWETIFRAIGAVEAGIKTPEEALEFVVNRMRGELGDEVIIRE